MIINLMIEKIELNLYIFKLVKGSELLGSFESDTIANGLRQAAELMVPAESAFHLIYEHVCAGTATVSTMRIDPNSLAHRLVSMHGMFAK
jgi:hypothetical protein